MKKYSIGLDIGINNIGWSIVNMEEKKVEKCGIRQFSVSAGAKERREIRNSRRRLKRKDTRKKDILSLCNKIGFPNKNTIDEKLIEKRVKGLKEKLEKQDIVNILCYMVTHRGYIPFGDEEVEFVNLNNKYPCEYYYDLYKNTTNNKYRNSKLIVKNSDNIREIKKILETQKKYYKEITEEFITNIIGNEKTSGVFNRKRKFWEGPGSINSLTEFGRFKSEEDVGNYLEMKKNNPNYEKYIFEDLIKKCEIEPEEKCASKLNFYAEKFNLLNDFINIGFKNIEDLTNQDCFYLHKNGMYKLNRQGLEKVFEYILDSKTVITKSLFKKLFNCDIENLSGYRIDKNRKIEISTMNGYRSIKNSFLENGGNIELINNIDDYNKIINAMTIAPGTIEVIRMINNNGINLSQNDENSIKASYKKVKGIKYHNLSEKALKRAIDDMLKYQLNYQQVNKKLNYNKKAREIFIKEYKKVSLNKKLDNITNRFVDDIIASPQVKKSLRQSIKVINAIINEKGYYPDTIVIESTKEANGEERKKELEEIQRKKEKLKKDAKELLEKISPEQITSKNIEKVVLYEEINGQCPYCGKSLDIMQVLNGGVDIEHILPKSKTFDDSFENKTLSCSKCNSQKDNKTPMQWLQKAERKRFEDRIKSNKKISSVKKDKFLYEDDLDKYKTRFFHRNLTDTAYATKELVKQINLFNDYLKEIKKEEPIKTISTPGQLTHNIRVKYNLEKNRDEGEKPYHHAVDATILAFMPITGLGKQISNFQNNPKFFILDGKDAIMDHINNSISDYNYEKQYHKNEYDAYIKQIKEITDENKIFRSSFEVQKDCNKTLSNANILKILKKGDNYFKVEQINNIYDPNLNLKLLDKLFDDSKNITLMCQDNNKELYNKLKKIYQEYKNTNEKISIYELYCREQKGLSDEQEFNYLTDGIRSSENKNSPIVKKLRYYSPINNPYLLEKKSINKKEETLIGLDSLAQTCTQVFYNKSKNCFAFLPIYSISVDLNTRKIIKNDYYKQMYNEYIKEDEVKHIVDLYNGNYIEVTKKDGTIIKGEYQYFHKTNAKCVLKNDVYFTKQDKKLVVKDKDVIGNEKERLTFEIK